MSHLLSFFLFPSLSWVWRFALVLQNRPVLQTSSFHSYVCVERKTKAVLSLPSWREGKGRIETLWLGGGGGEGQSPKNFFRPFGPHFSLKIRGEGPGHPGPPPGSATAMHRFSTARGKPVRRSNTRRLPLIRAKRLGYRGDSVMPLSDMVIHGCLFMTK